MTEEHNTYTRKIKIDHAEVQPYRDTPLIVTDDQLQAVTGANAIPLMPNTVWCVSSQEKVYGFINGEINDKRVTLQQIRSGAVVKSQTVVNGKTLNVFPAVINQPKVTWCEDIFCMCEAPEFEKCQTCVGCMNFVCGLGLCFGSCCCYGKSRPDCADVCGAGYLMFLASFVGYGEVLGCIVGYKMCCKKK
ncbi:Cysteine-rich_membrane protein 2 [Hexamita inflata]|uniref:Cysteine-rich membrane protein 2 n=1 Tax=Hexamita inflata TaxID=28002 RepID=A0AA86TLV3_9EUKA|nr:Cysteine-rich membrane protein 2 [Hexamita inflata]